MAEKTFNITNNGIDSTVVLPGSPIENDVVIVAGASDAIVGKSGSLSIIVTSGYTILEEDLAADGPGHVAKFKQLGGTPDDSITFNQALSTEDVACLIQVWRGADSSTPLDAARTVTTGGSVMPDSPSYTTITNIALVFAIGLLDDDNVAGSVTAPAGYSNLLAHDNTGLGSDNATVMIASYEKATAGVEDPAAFGGAGTDAWRAITFALRPAVGGGPAGPKRGQLIRVIEQDN